jgi:hypothetical protein
MSQYVLSVDMRTPYDWDTAPADGDFVALSAETGKAAYELLRSCMGPANAAGSAEFSEMVPVGGTDNYCIAFVARSTPANGLQLNAVQIRAVFSVDMDGSILMEFRERRVRLGESLLAFVQSVAQTTIVSEKVRPNVKLELFGSRLVHPASAMRLTTFLKVEQRYYNQRAVMLCKGLHGRSKDTSALFILDSALLCAIFRKSVAL